MQQFDNITSRIIDDLKKEIKKGGKVSIAASCFSIYAYENLKKELNSINELRFIFTSPTFLGDKFEKEKREFYIPRLNREKSLYGTEFEVRLRNQMNQKAISKECANWIREKVKFKSNISVNRGIVGFLNINEDYTYMPLDSFTTVDLGSERGNDIFKMTMKIPAPYTQQYIKGFEEVWNDQEHMQDVTEKVLEHIELVYDENSPEFIYMITLYNIFSEFLEDIEDNLPNEATGFKDSQIWNKLYSFQKDYEGVEDTLNNRLKTQKSISTIFNNAQRAFNAWSKLPLEERTTEKLLSELDFDFFEVLDSVTIARSRKHIEKYYNMEEIGKFPTRLPPINKSPALTDNKNIKINYEKIFKALDALNLSVYSPSSYLFPSRIRKYEEKYGKRGKMGISLAGRKFGLKKLMAVNLLKRLESSVYSFRITTNKILRQIEKAIHAIDHYDKNKTYNPFSEDMELDFDGELSDLISAGGKYQLDFKDMDYESWRTDLVSDQQILQDLLIKIEDITPENDKKLQTLINVIKNKVNHPINPGNKKIIIFTVFADTAEYLYNNINGFVKNELGLNSAMITGSTDGKTTIEKMPADFNTVLSCFSPISKDRSKLNKIPDGDIDILIGTDCISEGQNLHDCDYIINFDIHWNPVRVIQRFGRIDRIGSQNNKIQLVNFWPDLKLDEYINLKNRVETRMKITVMTSTGEDNPIDMAKKGDLEYRRKQLEKL